jgi:hypothetical protein
MEITASSVPGAPLLARTASPPGSRAAQPRSSRCTAAAWLLAATRLLPQSR